MFIHLTVTLNTLTLEWSSILQLCSLCVQHLFFLDSIISSLFFHLLHFLKIFSLRPIYSMVQIIKVLCVCFCPEYLLLKFSVFLFLYELVFPELLFSCQPQFFICCFPIAKPHFLGVVWSFFLFFSHSFDGNTFSSGFLRKRIQEVKCLHVWKCLGSTLTLNE